MTIVTPPQMLKGKVTLTLVKTVFQNCCNRVNSTAPGKRDQALLGTRGVGAWELPKGGCRGGRFLLKAGLRHQGCGVRNVIRACGPGVLDKLTSQDACRDRTRTGLTRSGGEAGSGLTCSWSGRLFVTGHPWEGLDGSSLMLLRTTLSHWDCMWSHLCR